MIRIGLGACAAAGYDVVFVLGDPRYYSRFGFSSERARSLDFPYPKETFMALELCPGALAGVAGKVVYPPPFEGV